MRSATRIASSRLRARPLAGCFRPSLATSLANRSRSSARSMLSGEVPRIGTPVGLQLGGELERRLPAQLDDHAPSNSPFSCLAVEDFEHILGGQRLEIEAVRRVRVGRHRLRVAIDHDRLEARASLPARRRRGSSNNRTRSPGRCGWARRRGSSTLRRSLKSPPRPRARRTAAPHRSSRDRAWPHRTRRRSCRSA